MILIRDSDLKHWFVTLIYYSTLWFTAFMTNLWFWFESLIHDSDLKHWFMTLMALIFDSESRIRFMSLISFIILIWDSDLWLMILICDSSETLIHESHYSDWWFHFETLIHVSNDSDSYLWFVTARFLRYFLQLHVIPGHMTEKQKHF